MNVVGIILAAGEGTRMGGAVKQMLPFNGKTVLEQVIDNATASLLQKVIVVIGHCTELITPMLSDRAVTAVLNSNYRKGQSSSLKAGLRALPDEVDAVLFILGDQPLVTPQTINLILNGFTELHSPIIIPVYKGERGNPVLFSRETFSDLSALDGDSGGRTLFKEYVGRILEVEVDDPHILSDLDTLEDYCELLRIATG